MTETGKVNPNDEPGQVSEVETDNVELASEPASGEPGRAHVEPAAADQVETGDEPVSIAEQIKSVLAEITAAETRRKELKQQADAAYKEHVSGLHKASWELDRTILGKSYDLGVKLKAFSDGPGHRNFKKSVKPRFGISYRTAADYMELAEWRDRIEAKVQQQRTIPEWAGGIALGAGIVIVLAGFRRS